VSSGRVVAVLGYSDRRGGGLHPVCAARLESALPFAEGARAIVLSGWARRRGARPEAELMKRAWRGRGADVVAEPHARTTAENAARVAAIAVRLQADELVVVTSGWHAPRARLLFLAALRGSGVRLSMVCAGEPGGLRHGLREAVRWPLVPAQLAIARRPAR
jgi:hypothetical protein